MKKGVTMLFVVMIALALVFGGSKASALSSMEIGSTLKIVGNECLIDRSLSVQSGVGYNGQVIDDNMYTSSMGFRGLSNISFNSNLEIYINTNETQENVTSTSTEVLYQSYGYSTHMRRSVSAKNYEVGAVAGVAVVGFSDTMLEFDMTPDTNYLGFEGTIEGKAKLTNMVVDPVTKERVVKDVISAVGEFKMDYTAWTEKPLDVGDEFGDWLGCP